MEENILVINKKIHSFRGHKVILDSDLAELYGVSTKDLNASVKRNSERFPNDFKFQLSQKEFEQLKTSSKVGGRRFLPYAFTEQGIAMLSSVLKSSKAIDINIQIMRAFVQMRQFLHSNKDLSEKLHDLELKYDHQFQVVFEAIRDVLFLKQKDKRKIGLK
jgi:hypothetical protein